MHKRKAQQASGHSTARHINTMVLFWQTLYTDGEMTKVCLANQQLCRAHRTCRTTLLVQQIAGRPSQLPNLLQCQCMLPCVTPPGAACSALLPYQHAADASTTAHPECLRVQVCLHACLHHPPCSSQHASMPTAEPCLLASVAAPSFCLQAAPSGHLFAAGETCMTRQA